MPSWFVIAFLSRSKHLLISWLQSPSAMILEPKKIKYDTVSIFSPSGCHEVALRSAGSCLGGVSEAVVGLQSLGSSLSAHGWGCVPTR